MVLLGGAITAAENVLRPVVIGRDTEMPDYLIVVSTLGGIVAGPVIGVLLLVL